jgi:hypothetical protein
MSQVLDTEEQGFWVFTQLMESLLPINHYTQMIGVQIDVRVFSWCIKEYLPKLWAHFNRYQFDPMFFSLNWFICLFCDKLDQNVALAVLDQIMIRGSEILHNIGLSILYIMQDQIFMMKDFCKLLFIFKIKILE